MAVNDMVSDYLGKAKDSMEQGNVFQVTSALESAKCCAERTDMAYEVGRLRSRSLELLAYRVQHAARSDTRPGAGGSIRSISSRCIDRYIDEWPTEDVSIRADYVVQDELDRARQALKIGNYAAASLGVYIARGFLDLAGRRIPQSINEVEADITAAMENAVTRR